jgi:hypothetical protein
MGAAMSFIRDTRSVEQQRFFSGQRLEEGDLQGIEAFNREMRWLHNQSLHQPGIGNGFAVSGKKGDREVTVGPGYAIDDFGREIVLTSSRTIPVPPVAGDVGGVPKRFLLTVEYPEDVDLEVVERRRGICGDEGATRQRVEPIFCWVPLFSNGNPEHSAHAIQTGHQLVLAEAAVRDCKLDKEIGIAQRRNAKPSSQPYIACGEQIPTGWRIWFLPDNNPDVELSANLQRSPQFIGGIEADIDTASGGFLTEPDYFARLNGPRFFEISSGEVNGQGTSGFIVDGLLHIINPTATGFTARVLVLYFGPSSGLVSRVFAPEGTGGVAGGAGDGTVLRAAVSTGTGTVNSDPLPEDSPLSQWTIVWMGIEG